MEFLNIALRLLAVSQLLLLGLLIAPSQNPMRVRVVALMLVAGVISYLIISLAKQNPVLLAFYELLWLWYPANITPSLLLLLVWFIFEEKCCAPLWLTLIVAFDLLSSVWFYYHCIGLHVPPVWVPVSKVLISIGAILVVWVGRENDLIEVRCKVRNLIVFAVGLIMSVIYITEIVTGFNISVMVSSIEAAFLFVLTLVCNYYFIKLYPHFQLVSVRPVIKEDSEDKVIIELLERMVSERLYTDHDLRVGSLAAMLNIPEYKLRKKINQKLGYRNFNQFVNHYRIEEASVKLLEDGRLPVLSVALDVGFRSISSFNTAFQTQFGVSPTQYRHQQS